MPGQYSFVASFESSIMNFLITTFVLSTLISLQVGVNAEDKACKTAVGDITKKQLKGVTECTAQMKFKNAKERQAKMTCVMKCVLMREGILTPDALPDPIGSLKFITVNLPNHVQEWARTVMMGCFEVTALANPAEENCKSYDPLIKCALTSLNMFCQPPK